MSRYVDNARYVYSALRRLPWCTCVSASARQSVPKKKQRKQTTQGRDGRTARPRVKFLFSLSRSCRCSASPRWPALCCRSVCPAPPHAPPRPAAAPSQRGALARRADRQMHRLENMDRDAWRQRAGRHLERVRRLREHGLGRRDRIVRRRPRPSHARRAREPCARGASHITTRTLIARAPSVAVRSPPRVSA